MVYLARIVNSRDLKERATLQQLAQKSDAMGGLLRLDERVHIAYRSLSFMS